MGGVERGSNEAGGDLDRRVSDCLRDGDTARAATVALGALGPEVFGFLLGVLKEDDAEDVFSAFSERLWRSLSTFQGRCSVRTWSYVLARHEIDRYRRRTPDRKAVHVPIADFESILARARTVSQSDLGSDKRRALAKLREELSLEDRSLLVLRVDRKLSWEDIALAFAESPETLDDAQRKRESARLRKRFQMLKDKLVAKARDPRRKTRPLERNS
jgi:RNA polymerase sigma-70 factor (ECF subfamily)